MNSKVESGLAAVAPYAIFAGLGYIALQLLKDIGPKAAEAGGQAVGGVVGGGISGLIKGVGGALGMDPDLTGIVAREVLPADAGGLRKTASILSPPNNGSAARPLMSSTYKVQAVINWDKDQACIVTFEAKEYPRVIGANGVQRKTSSIALHPGRNVVEVAMPFGGGLLTDIVLTLGIDGDQYAMSVYTCE